MRSIRRSLLGYLLVLLALALGAVWAFVDRFAVAALRDREAADTQRIEQDYRLRRAEVAKRFDADLMADARDLFSELQGKAAGQLGFARLAPYRLPPGGRAADPARSPGPPRPPELPRPPDPLAAPPEDVLAFRQRLAALLAGPPQSPLARVPLVTLARPNSPAWTAYQSPRPVGRAVDAFQQIGRPADPPPTAEDDPHPYFQLHVVVYYPPTGTRVVRVVRPARVGADLPFDLEAVERDPDFEFKHDDIVIPGPGECRRVVLAGRLAWYGLPSQPPVRGGFGPLRPADRIGPDFVIRVFAHAARPLSELAQQLKSDERDRDIQLARVRAETRDGLAHLRAWLGGIVGTSFLALVVGGGVIVARGLAPLHKLSHAVSRVSEKDFRLPVGPDELSRELAPIHDRLTRTFDLLRRAFAREKQAVADLSHELRTPIASLLATIDVALRKPRSPDQYRATLEDCRAIAKQLGHLVERIMTLASLDAGTVRPAVGRADAAAVAAACGAVIRPLAEAHGLTFVAPPAPAAGLDTDPDQLREILVNLLHNAVEYNRPGGRVELHVRRHNGRVVFEVRDTGIGMTADIREKIFERFYRADPSRHATGVHAGLGLAIVKEYVDRLGGAIEVESEPGEGSTFRVAFPAAEPDPPDQPPEAAPPAPRPRSAAAPSRTRLAPPAAPG